MAYRLLTTHQFEKDLKRCKKRGLPMDKLKEVINELGELKAEYGDIGHELNSAAEGFIRLFKVSLFFLFFWSVIMKYSFDYLGNVTALGHMAIYIPFVYWLVHAVISSTLKKTKKEK